eukprot:gene17881-29664_t
MTRLVVMAGDWAQLAFPQSEPLCLWPKLFRRMPAPKHSNRRLEELAGTEGRKRAKNDLHVDRLRALNGFAAHERVPQTVPGPDADLHELFCGDRDPRRQHAYEAYLRSTGDVVEFPTLLRRMREGVLVNGSEEEMKEAVHLARQVFGEHRQTPAVLADPHAFPADATRHIAIQWDFIQRSDPVQMVYTFAAHDVELPGSTPLTPDERRILRHHPNPNKTAGRLGVLSVFAGLHVELTEKVGGILKATPGVVEHRRDGEVVLRYNPLLCLPSLLVRLAGYADGPIPERPDLLLLEPTRSHSFRWDWKTQRQLNSKQ